MNRYFSIYTNRILTAAGVIALAAVIIFQTGCSAVNEDILPDPAESSPIVIISPQSGFETSDVTDYVYSTLTESEKTAYDAIVSAVLDYKPYVKFSETFSSKDIIKLFKLVYTQESRIFWLSNIFLNSPEASDTLNLNYRYSVSGLDIMKGELDLAVGTVLGGLPANCTPYEAVVYFHDVIVKGCSFSAETEHANSAYGVLVDGYAQCEGYAFAMSLLCDNTNIENYVVTGTNTDGISHAWNKIKLNNEWYNVDCTWNDPVLKHENPLFVKHDYLLVPDRDILNISHFQDTEYFEPPACTEESLNYFIMQGLMFNNAEDGIHNLTEQIKKLAVAGLREAEIRFSNTNEYTTAVSRLFDNNEIKVIIDNINGNNGAGIKSAYKYNNDDLCIIHISLIYEKDSDL